MRNVYVSTPLLQMMIPAPNPLIHGIPAGQWLKQMIWVIRHLFFRLLQQLQVHLPVLPSLLDLVLQVLLNQMALTQFHTQLRPIRLMT